MRALVAADAPAKARIQAIVILLDRGWGKVPQPHTGEDDKDIRITPSIRMDVGVCHSTAGNAPDAAALGVAGMRHDAPPVVWKPRVPSHS